MAKSTYDLQVKIIPKRLRAFKKMMKQFNKLIPDDLTEDEKKALSKLYSPLIKKLVKFTYNLRSVKKDA